MNVPVDLMSGMVSGTAGDVIDLKNQPYVKYGENRLPEDLYPYIENDLEIYKEDF